VVRRALLARTSLLLLAALAACASPRPTTATIPGAGPGTVAVVAEVVDGDTLQVEVGGAIEQVRLLGIDTPETVHPSKPVQCWGPEASARTHELLPEGTEVLLQRDAEARDRYGRLLVYVWRRADHLFVNRALVAEGHARTLSIEPNTTHRATLAAAEHAARTAGAGLWGACPVGEPQG
jgi:micrococcal nuclease